MNHPRFLWQSTSTRLRRWTLGGVLFILVAYGYYFTSFRTNPIPTLTALDIDLDQPPTYKRLREWEANLPQHNLDLPFPEGRTGRYVLFKNQIQQLGWNNQLNEVLMNTWLAYKSKRAYVFQDYIWLVGYYPWPKEKHLEENPRTPLNALLFGPSSGAPWDPDDNAPRSISEKWFDIVCPKSERRIILTGDVKPAIYWESGDVIFNHWQKLLTDAPERCIEIQGSNWENDKTPQTFDLWLWGTTRILPLWEDFKNSPVSRLLETSSIVKSAVDRNEYLFLPRAPRLPRPAPRPAPRDPYERMLAIHLRRGDYQNACLGLANWNSTFYSWNLLPFLPDKFTHPDGYEWGKATPEGIAHYKKHCYPDDDMILEKIQKSREDYIQAGSPGEHRVLDVIFLLTNDGTSWVDGLKAKLRELGWYTIVTTKDLELDQEQKDVNLAVDMDFARKAAVFIGNGWSSFTSNIVHRRLFDGKEPISIRFL